MDEKEKRQLLLLADHYFQSNNYPFAEHILEKVIQSEPNNSKANELLAYIFGNRGDEKQSFSLLQLACHQSDCSPEALYYFGLANLKRQFYREAIDLLKKSITKAGEYFEALHDLATAYGQLGEAENALLYFEKCLKLNTNSFELFFNTGRTLEDLNQNKEALVQYERALGLNPNFSQAWFNKGCLLIKLKRFDDALLSFEQVLRLQPENAEAWFTKGFVVYELKRYEEAITHYDRALVLNPNLAEAWSNKGLTLHELKRYEEAITHYDRALVLSPNLAEAWSNKGLTLHELKRYEEAIAHHDQALILKKDYPKAWLNKGLSLNQMKRHDEALFHFNTAIDLQPDYAEAWANKGTVFYELGDHLNAIKHIDQALHLKSDVLWLQGDLLHIKMRIANWHDFHTALDDLIIRIQSDQKVIQPFTLLSLTDSAALHQQCSVIYSRDRYPINLSLGPITKNPYKDKIRIAYFSPDFKNHAVSYLTAEVFEKHDRNHYEVIGISLQKAPANDDLSQRLRIAFDQFIDAEHMADIEIARLVRSMEIDIAIDLSGHTQHARTGAFSYRLAPIQVNWLGYPGTLGADFIDYILADQTIIPPSHQVFYTEKVAYLPHTYMVDDSNRIPAKKKFTKSELGLPDEGFVFCCFNNDYKLNEQVITSWSNILRESPKAILWISENNPQFQMNLAAELNHRGINTDRIVFAKRLDSMADHLARYALADLFLDTFPYNAHTTAIDCLKAGTPLLTLLGESFAGRVAASLLNAIGLPELIVTSIAEYESLAIKLANDPEKLLAIRQKLAANRFSMPLFNTPLFTRHLESAYRQMYERYQTGLEPDHLFVTAG